MVSNGELDRAVSTPPSKMHEYDQTNITEPQHQEKTARNRKSSCQNNIIRSCHGKIAVNNRNNALDYFMAKQLCSLQARLYSLLDIQRWESFRDSLQT